jgi:cytochrome c biogenesis protein CcdA
MDERAMFGKAAVVAILLVLLASVLGMLLFSEPSSRASTKDGVVEFVVFDNPDCPNCKTVAKELLPKMEQKYGDKIKFKYLDLRNFDSVRAMVDLDAQYHYTKFAIPQIAIGGDLLIGPDQVTTELDSVIQKYLAAGGTDLPPLSTANQHPTESGFNPIYVTYFYKKGCRNCDAVSLDLNYSKRFITNMHLKEYDISTKEGIVMDEAFCDMANVPDKDKGKTPAVFVGTEYLFGDKLTPQNLQSSIDKVKLSGTPDVWKTVESYLEVARSSLKTRMGEMAIFPVLGAGLIDGINPCVFTVLIFLISYLAFIGRKGKDVLFVGAAFTIASFAVYLAIGFGLLTFMQALGGAGKWVSLGLAILTLLFGVAALYDYIQSKRKPGEISSTLGLPSNLTQRIHKLIREKTRLRSLVAVGVVLGVLLTLIELGCTGQVYLPTISFMARAGGGKAILYLIAYNVMAILPLIVVFMLVYFGTSSEKLVEFGRKHTPTMELLSALLFFGLSALLFVTL